MRNIYIYSAPVHSGKTSRLRKYIQNKSSVYGLLCPDVDGLRVIEELDTGVMYPFQTESSEEVVSVGKYLFLESGFRTGQEIIHSLDSKGQGLYVVDEIGKLEIKDHGFEPAFSAFLSAFKQRTDASELILVVRDYLLEDAKLKYDLNEAITIGHDFFDAP